MKVTYKNRTLRKIGFIRTVGDLKEIQTDFKPVIISDKKYEEVDTIQLKDDDSYRKKYDEYKAAIDELDKFNDKVNNYYRECKEISDSNIPAEDKEKQMKLLRQKYEFGDGDVHKYINKEMSNKQYEIDQMCVALREPREKFINEIIEQINNINVAQLEGRMIVLDLDSPILSDIIIVVNTYEHEDDDDNPVTSGLKIASNIIEANDKEGYFISMKAVDNRATQIDDKKIFTDVNYLHLLMINGITRAITVKGTDQIKKNTIERQLVNKLLHLRSFDLVIKFSYYDKKNVPAIYQTLIPASYPIINTPYKYPNCYMYYILKYFFPYCCSTSTITNDNLSMI